ncbi:hypothetical protein [Holospora curviuscula]|uniref:Uncharacterized protein n=1 Tax=Holospora curviuscula TaxID=1082868 RepID=A0A2S5REC9_9PROT|nr:hypothetical protein [Holospora curviuscula]PPE05572.1 hypothetical protein HCUR_00218 [Holospora curviuscula]
MKRAASSFWVVFSVLDGPNAGQKWLKASNYGEPTAIIYFQKAPYTLLSSIVSLGSVLKGEQGVCNAQEPISATKVSVS